MLSDAVCNIPQHQTLVLYLLMGDITVGMVHKTNSPVTLTDFIVGFYFWFSSATNLKSRQSLLDCCRNVECVCV